jgi:hypothetical protein
VYFYYLEEHSDQGNGGGGANTAVVVELDNDRILSRRNKENEGWGSCSDVEPLDPTTRHRLIAHWLGLRDRDVPWHATDTITIVWTDRAAYARRLGEIVESQRRKLRDTVQQLQERGFLGEEESKKLTPKLVLTIECDMKPCPL